MMVAEMKQRKAEAKTIVRASKDRFLFSYTFINASVEERWRQNEEGQASISPFHSQRCVHFNFSFYLS